MIGLQKAMPPAESKWTGWPTELRHRIMVIIATTRCVWSLQVSGDVPAVRGPAGQA
jgi:hypothetical protein